MHVLKEDGFRVQVPVDLYGTGAGSMASSQNNPRPQQMLLLLLDPKPSTQNRNTLNTKCRGDHGKGGTLNPEPHPGLTQSLLSGPGLGFRV